MNAVSVGMVPAQMMRIRDELSHENTAREALLDATMGPIRFKRSSERLREGRLPALSLVAVDGNGALTGTVRLWHARACGLPHALMLGPLAVSALHRQGELQSRGGRAAAVAYAVYGDKRPADGLQGIRGTVARPNQPAQGIGLVPHRARPFPGRAVVVCRVPLTQALTSSFTKRPISMYWHRQL